MASLIDPPAETSAPAEAPVAPLKQGSPGVRQADAVDADPTPPGPVPVLARLREWFREDGYWYATSAVVHAIGFVIFALVVTFLPHFLPTGLDLSGTGEAPEFQAAEQQDTQAPDFAKFELGNPREKTGNISTEALREMQAPAGKAVYIDDSTEYEPAGGGMATEPGGAPLGGIGGFTVAGVQGIGGRGGVGGGQGTSKYPGMGGSEIGFGLRGKGSRAGGGSGPTRDTDRAVLGGLVWLAKHQGPNGAWSLQHSRFCPTRQSCGGQGTYMQSDAAATALALLPFLGAGQTHQTNGPFKKEITKGLNWLIKQQAPDGNLAHRGGRSADDVERKPMYTHALGTLVLCEAYGMTRDPKVGGPASRAVRFIELAQNQSTGAWRYHAQDPDGDTSVVGWQVMALKSAQMAGLGVNSVTLESPRKWLRSVAVGRNQGLFCYRPYERESPSMTAVGQLCLQYMGSAPDDAALLEGKQYLMANLPDGNLQRDIYYWYYATLVLHNYLDQDWDKWNRVMRRTLVNTQVREGCGTGSWDPDHPTLDRWGSAGGRLYMTSLSVLTLEVYYRYMPLFRLNGPPPTLQAPEKKAPPPAEKPPAEK